jgi:PAS domain S-box-containing protein
LPEHPLPVQAGFVTPQASEQDCDPPGAAMERFQPDPSVILDQTGKNFDTAMLDSTGINPYNVAQYSDDVQMDMGSIAPNGFDATESGLEVPGLVNENKTDSSDSTNNLNNINGNGVGAGPLPAGFGANYAGSGSSTLTEFTKRRNWSQRVLEELKDLLYILTPDGRLLYVSPSAKALTGYEPSELAGKFLADFLHADDSSLFIREFNESIATGNPLRLFYRFRNGDGKYSIFECHGHPHLTNDVSHLEATGGPVNTAGFCRGFFMMARPYPTANSQLLDSFLEHKVENVRLQARIAALKREEAEEAESQAKHFHKKPGGALARTESSDMTPMSPSQTSKGDSAETNPMPPPAKPTISNVALTREALDEANAFARPDSITDKMARYEGSSHVETIEMLTGLRYREGERSHGISTGGTSPALIRGDAGIDIPADKTDPRYAGASYLDKKVKKIKSADEYVCTDCGTLDSPEWRRGPSGPKTLCNACGLRWAKKEKKKSGPGTVDTGSNVTPPGGVVNSTPAVPGLKTSESNESV